MISPFILNFSFCIVFSHKISHLISKSASSGQFVAGPYYRVGPTPFFMCVYTKYNCRLSSQLLSIRCKMYTV